MDVAKNNVAGIGNNYLKNRHFLYKMSPDEIVGIGIYAAEKRLVYFGILKTDVWAIERRFLIPRQTHERRHAYFERY